MNTQKTRRQFLKITGMAGAAVLTGSFYSCTTKPLKPNIIYIMADDLGYADLGCYGQKLIQTPNIDRLAKMGKRFTQVYSGSTVCAPARSVLMTGLHTGHTRLRGNASQLGQTKDPFENNRRVSLEPEDVTIAQLLKNAGYATGISGKWGIGEAGTSGVPNKKGFDQWLGYLNQNHAPFFYSDYLWKNEEKISIEENKDGQRKVYTHDLFTQFALDFITEHKEEPFFLYMPYCIPHREFEVPDLGIYADKPWPEEAKIYAAMISRLDRDVGRIMDTLAENGLENNTIVFFTSDNGVEQKPHDWNDLFNHSNPFRGYKGDVFEGGLRVPMIVSWPGRVEPGTTSDAAWYFADFLPTAADLTGIPVKIPVDGISVLPSILGEKQDTGDRFLYWEYVHPYFMQAVRWKNWKAVRLDQGDIMLFDLSKDVAEKNDVSKQNPQVVARIEEFLKTARTESKYWPVEIPENVK